MKPETKAKLEELIIEAHNRKDPAMVAFLRVLLNYQPKKKAPVTAEAF